MYTYIRKDKKQAKRCVLDTLHLNNNNNNICVYIIINIIY